MKQTIRHLDDNIRPTNEAIQKLTEILKTGCKDGIVDIIWGPDIECQIIEVDTGDNVKDVIEKPAQ